VVGKYVGSLVGVFVGSAVVGKGEDVVETSAAFVGRIVDESFDGNCVGRFVDGSLVGIFVESFVVGKNVGSFGHNRISPQHAPSGTGALLPSLQTAVGHMKPTHSGSFDDGDVG